MHSGMGGGGENVVTNKVLTNIDVCVYTIRYVRSIKASSA